MISHALFPTLVAEFQYQRHEEFRDIFMDVGLKHFDQNGYSHEGTGHVTIHHEPAFEALFRYLSQCVVEYLNTLHVDSENFEINIVKSWLNVLCDNATPIHSHGDAHISFVYYVNLPEDKTQPIRFHSVIKEPFVGCIRHNNSRDIWTHLNSYSWSFTPKQGTVFVFPATLTHDTIGKEIVKLDEPTKTKPDLFNRRISIASDVVLTYKQKMGKPLGIQPISNWRKFV